MQYGKMTTAKHALKLRIVKILAADGHYATYKAVGDYLGVHWRALMNARRDPRDDLNSHIILRSSLYWQPQVASKVWLPGPAFNGYIDAKLQSDRRGGP